MKRYKSKDRRNKSGLSWVGNDRENILIRMCEMIGKEEKSDGSIPLLNKEVNKENEQ